LRGGSVNKLVVFGLAVLSVFVIAQIRKKMQSPEFQQYIAERTNDHATNE
jgi:hypothetical protein